jgi:hypothetical protein
MSAPYSITNWSEFQHYKDRSAPWVKLYRDLLTSESWVLGSDLSRVVQIASVLLAIRYDNRIPLNFALLKKVMSLECTEPEFMAAIEHLRETSFLSVEGLTQPRAQLASAPLADCPSEESRAEERRGEQKRDPSTASTVVALASPPSDVDRVFEHWRSTWNHPAAVLDAKRRRTITAALRAYSADQLIEAIDGYRASPHHTGQNERGTVYDEITLFLRDAAHIDAGLRFARQAPRADLSKLTRRNVAAVETWTPPEARNAGA